MSDDQNYSLPNSHKISSPINIMDSVDIPDSIEVSGFQIKESKTKQNTAEDEENVITDNLKKPEDQIEEHRIDEKYKAIENEREQTEQKKTEEQNQTRKSPRTTQNANKIKDQYNTIKVTRKRKFPKEKYDPINISSLRTEHSKKRVPGKIIDKFWEPLEPKLMESLDKIFLISLNKTIEKYNISNSNKLSKRMAEAQNIITREWLNEDDSNSFKSRLKSTKVPLTTSVLSNPKSNESIDIFSFDQLRRRKISLETYLSAELKQLNELEKLYNNLETVLESDSQYLEEFKRTTTINISKMKEDINQKKETLGFNNINELQADMVTHSTKESYKLFKPHSDKEVQNLLEKLNNKLAKVNDATKHSTKLTDKINALYSILEML